MRKPRPGGDLEGRPRRTSAAAALLALPALPVLLLALTALTAPAARAGNVPLNVDEPMGVARKSFPIRVGIPFPRGQLRSPAAAVLSPGGQAVPSQVQPWVRWGDGSIKWLMVDFLADVPAGGRARYQLAPGRAGSAGKRISVQKSGNSVTVNTGPLKFTVTGSGIQQVWLDLNGNGNFEASEKIQSSSLLVVTAGSSPTASGGGRPFVAQGTSGRVTVEESGPLVAIIKCEGKHAGRFPYVLRIRAYAGLSTVKVFHTLIIDGNPEREFVTSCGMKFGLALQGGKTFGVGGGISRKDQWGGLALDRAAASSYGPARGPVVVHQSNWNRYTISGAGRGGTHHQGWIDLSDSRGGLTAGVRNFWRLYGKALKVDPTQGSVSVCLWPPMGKPLDLRRHSDIMNEKPKSGKVKRGKPHPGAEESVGTALGIARTHEIVLYYHKGSARTAGSEAVAAAFNRPSIAYATPRWYADSLACGEYAPYSQGNAATEEWFRRILLWYYWNQQNDPDGWRWSGKVMNVRPKGPWFGWVDFGDLQTSYRDPSRPNGGWQYDNGRYSWNCGEPDVGHALFLHYIRTGERAYYDLAEAFALHEMGIDNNHLPEDPDRFGGGRRHCVSHWGEESAFYGASHTWVEGWLDYYKLSGYRRALDVSKNGVEFGWRTINKGKREVGSDGRLTNKRKTVLWDREYCLPVKNIVYYWETTKQNKGRVDNVLGTYLDNQHSDGCWPARFDWAGKTGSSRNKRVYTKSRSSFKSSVGGFSVYYVDPSLHTYWLETGDKRSEAGLIKHADFLLRKIDRHPEYALQALGFAYLRTQNRKYLTAGASAIRRMCSAGGGRFSPGRHTKKSLFSALGGNNGPHRSGNGRLRSQSRPLIGAPVMMKAMGAGR